MANYEYKCVSVPKQLVVQSVNDSAKAIASYGKVLPVSFNMLVFRREK